MKIGVFGGTFDPPHLGHLSLAQACMAQLELDEIIFLPANRNPLKARRVITSAEDRFSMVARLIEKEPNMAVSDMEITRGGVSYTVDTLGELQMVRPADYWFLMGADALKALPNWKNPHRLLRLCRVGVVVRPPLTDADVIMKLPDEFKDKVDLVHMDPVEVSSTDLRDRLGRNLNVSPWVPGGVQRYIQEKKLYRN